jgi:hypothetical protein
MQLNAKIQVVRISENRPAATIPLKWGNRQRPIANLFHVIGVCSEDVSLGPLGLNSHQPNVESSSAQEAADRFHCA